MDLREDCVPQLEKLLDDQDDYVVSAAAASLGRLDSKSSVEVIAKHLKKIPKAGCQALVKLKARELLLEIAKLLLDEGLGAMMPLLRWHY